MALSKELSDKKKITLYHCFGELTSERKTINMEGESFYTTLNGAVIAYLQSIHDGDELESMKGKVLSISKIDFRSDSYNNPNHTDDFIQNGNLVHVGLGNYMYNMHMEARTLVDFRATPQAHSDTAAFDHIQTEKVTL